MTIEEMKSRQRELEAMNLNSLSPEQGRAVTEELGILGASLLFAELRFTEATNESTPLPTSNKPPPAPPFLRGA